MLGNVTKNAKLEVLFASFVLCVTNNVSRFENTHFNLQFCLNFKLVRNNYLLAYVFQTLFGWDTIITHYFD